ncbi:MAG: DUF1016 N-terminal domain-containing protein [Verrucomicrobiales bacterium]|nr:DUF1016 N-terminal domain-containing protein [Verrucomicrobiales bacterium]
MTSVATHDSGELPASYPRLLEEEEIKARIRAAQTKATLAANREMILLYWEIGRDILQRQTDEGWGAKVIDRLSNDLRAAFPSHQGFSPRNLKYMRAFAAAWPDELIVQQVAAQIPWFHNCLLLDRLTQTEDRLFYIRKTLEHGWSRAILRIQMESNLHRRAGKALTNFKETCRHHNPTWPSRPRATRMFSTS